MQAHLSILCSKMQQVSKPQDIVQSRMRLHCSSGKCYYIFNLRYSRRKCYISFGPSIKPDKTFLRECAHVQSCICLRYSRGKCVISFFSAISVFNYLLLVSSPDNLFKQLGPRSGSTMRMRACEVSFEPFCCWRGQCCIQASSHNSV